MGVSKQLYRKGIEGTSLLEGIKGKKGEDDGCSL